MINITNRNIFFLVIPQNLCEIRAQEISQFNGCSVPEWLEYQANSHGEKIVDYTQVFEIDCNKHDICYGCVSYFCFIWIYLERHFYITAHGIILNII